MISKPNIDIHAHFYPEPYLKLLAQEGERFGIKLDRKRPKEVVIDIKGSRLSLGPAFTDLDVRLKEMKRQRVDVHALSLTRPMVYWADAELGLKLSQAMNDAMVEAHTAFPDRFLGLAVLPMQDIPSSLAELERVSKLAGIRGVYIGTNINGKDLSDPEFLPLFQRIEALRLPIFLHPTQVIPTERLKPYFFYNLIGFPLDTTIAAANLIFSGILDRFPRLSICLPHAGGALLSLIGRMDRGHKITEECRQIKHKPSAYLKRFTYDTISHDPGMLLYLIRLVGAERVMIGSDYCFAIGYDRPVEVVTKLAALSRADQSRILGSNAARLLKFG
ncbi:MAG: amidohydrolase family protein [Deltaproteobacteria bacterium]|nr:amidohydrolase family protein [Deltaproteobacteria bacterium]MDZ4343394.1 amidohydrolase family protein [Candidatus Binatia bacterium]